MQRVHNESGSSKTVPDGATVSLTNRRELNEEGAHCTNSKLICKFERARIPSRLFTRCINHLEGNASGGRGFSGASSEKHCARKYSAKYLKNG